MLKEPDFAIFDDVKKNALEGVRKEQERMNP